MFEELQKRLSELPQPISIGKLDADVHYKLSMSLNIEEFPALMLRGQGYRRKYEGSLGFWNDEGIYIENTKS